MKTPDELVLAAQAAIEKGAVQSTTRKLLTWYGAHRRGSWIVGNIRRDLRKLKIRTEPDFETVWVDVPISILPLAGEKTEAAKPTKSEPDASVATLKEDGSDVAPSHRISRLKAANTRPISVRPTDTVQKAVTLMMSYNFSQLPVMNGERDVRGIVTWRGIGNRLVLGKTCETLKEVTEPHHEVRDTASMFDVLLSLSKFDCVLVRNATQIITGIVTAADISEQFRLLSEPFLLLGDIENHVRRLIEKFFTPDEIKKACALNESSKKIESVIDMGFGDYLRLLQNPEHWAKLKLSLDRAVFSEKLDEVRVIRNEVMHFDPDGVEDKQIETLRQFASFLDKALSLID